MKDIIWDKYRTTEPEIKVLDHGFVRLIDCMPRVLREGEDTADYAIAEAARCSFNRDKKTKIQDAVLNRYLMRHNHTSPFEMVEFKFDMKLPIFVARQIVRHRMVSANELSGRYSEMPEEYYIPEKNNVRGQSIINTQGSEGISVLAEVFIDDLEATSKRCFKTYKDHLKNKISREQARIFLPLNTYTQWYWKIDLHNLLHFLDLRCDHHAQKETQCYANAILSLISPLIPVTIEAWEDYSPYRNGLLLTRFEIDALKNILKDKEIPEIGVPNKLEQLEWQEKAEKLGLKNIEKNVDF